MDFSWWPVLVLPFPYLEDGITLDFTPVDQYLHMVGDVVGPLLVFIAVFLIVRRLVVSVSGGD